MALVSDGWLAERFGHPVWTVRDEPAEEVLDHVAGHPGRALYQAKVETDNVARVLELGTAGLMPVNVNTVLARAATGPEANPPAGLEVRRIQPADTELADVAERSFSKTRFHLDPRVPNAVADRIKRDWVVSYLEGTRGETAYVAMRDGHPVGFLLVLATHAERVIDLMGVAVEARGAGAGAALVERFVADSAGTCASVRVGTQAANPAGTRFYESQGFRAAGAVYDMHRLEG